MTLRDVAGATLVAAAFVSSWTGLNLAGLKPVDWLLFLTLLLLALDLLATGEFVVIPVWVGVGSVALLSLVAYNEVWPISPAYTQGRFISPVASVTPSLEGGSGSNGLQWFAALCLLPLLTVALARFEPRIVPWVAVAWLLGIGVSSLVAVTDFSGLTALSSHWIKYQGAGLRQAGLTVHSNNVGVAAAIAMPVAVWVMSHRRKAGLALVSLLLVGAVISGSRGGQAGTALALALTVVLVGDARRLAIRLLATGLLAVVGLAWFLPSFIARVSALFRFSGGVAAESDMDRRSRRIQGFLDFHERPLSGIGFEAMNDAHSIYVQVLAVGGMTLAACLTFYFTGALQTAWLERNVDGSIAPYLGVSVLVWLLVGTVENQLTDRYLYVPVACLAAVAALRSWGPTPTARQEKPGVQLAVSGTRL